MLIIQCLQLHENMRFDEQAHTLSKEYQSKENQAIWAKRVEQNKPQFHLGTLPLENGDRKPTQCFTLINFVGSLDSLSGTT